MKAIYPLFSALIFFSSSVFANEHLSYTFVELDYVNINIEGFDNNKDFPKNYEDGNGWSVRGSYGFAENWFVFSNYSSVQSDVGFVNDSDQFFNRDTDINRFNLGAGYHIPLNDQSDLIFSGAYADIDIENFDFGSNGSGGINNLTDDSSDGFYIDMSLRSQLVPWLEGSVGGRYTDIGNVDNVSLVANLLFEIAPMYAINLGVDIGDELTTWMVGVRFSI